MELGTVGFQVGVGFHFGFRLGGASCWGSGALDPKVGGLRVLGGEVGWPLPHSGVPDLRHRRG